MYIKPVKLTPVNVYKQKHESGILPKTVDTSISRKILLF